MSKKKMLDPFKPGMDDPDALHGPALLDEQLLTWAIDTDNLPAYTGIKTPEQINAVLAEMKNDNKSQ